MFEEYKAKCLEDGVRPGNEHIYRDIFNRESMWIFRSLKKDKRHV